MARIHNDLFIFASKEALVNIKKVKKPQQTFIEKRKRKCEIENMSKYELKRN